MEDNVVQGGFGAGILESLSRLGVTNVAVKLHGLPDEFVEHGTPSELYNLYKLDAAGIAEVVRDFLLLRKKTSASQLISS